jgi:hypothetical protein
MVKFEHACFITLWSCYYIVAEFGSFWPVIRLNLHKLLAYWLLERPTYLSVSLYVYEVREIDLHCWSSDSSRYLSLLT